ncbi:hypothetical protein [Hymenobacter rigui]|uniref:Uncharacterized protein n=1 Tax=Hymenobacter rigui TaxID=334424 RepID=A0A428KQJ2_9BACT|nr:hypothetical protein [Hymenobacter rigui]RSK48781.1 hypothetical protein EI291_09435 [Hymenobacter rigui]
MITAEHIQTYRYYAGDIDAWARLKNSESTMTDGIWYTIQNILHDLYLTKHANTSEIFRQQLSNQIRAVCENPQVEKELLELSAETNP